MKYKELKGLCKDCLGCITLENPNYIGTYNCIWYVKGKKEQTNDNKNTASMQK